MTLSLSDDQIRRLRLRAQQLSQEPAGEPVPAAQVVKRVCGLQAQDLRAAELAVRARSPRITAAVIEQARLQERSVLRLWAMRGTLHLLATEDFRWLLPLLGPVFIAAGDRRRQELGLDEAMSVKGVDVIQEALAEQGPLTRKEIAPYLQTAGIRTEGQALIHLIALAALEGVLCCGPERDGEPTYVRIKDWIGRQPFISLPREAALAELARRYFRAYGPASLDDLAAWSGLKIGELRPACQQIAGEMVQVDAAGQLNWLPKEQLEWVDLPQPESPLVRLLPRFDTYLLGYSSRKLAVAPQHEKRIHPGGGILHPVLLVDGRLLGVWGLKSRRGLLEVVVEPFAVLAAPVRAGLDVEVAAMGHFYEIDAKLSITSITGADHS